MEFDCDRQLQQSLSCLCQDLPQRVLCVQYTLIHPRLVTLLNRSEVLQPYVAHKCDPLEPCGRKRVFKAEQESGAQKAAGAHIKLFFLGGHVPFLH